MAARAPNAHALGLLSQTHPDVFREWCETPTERTKMEHVINLVNEFFVYMLNENGQNADQWQYWTQHHPNDQGGAMLATFVRYLLLYWCA